MENRTAREKVTRLFRFLNEFAAIRFPFPRDVERERTHLWLAGFPEHPAIEIQRIVPEEYDPSEGSEPLALIRIRRPRLSMPPSLPQELQGWVQSPWDHPFGEPKVYTERSIAARDGRSIIVRFDEDERRVREWRAWLHRWRVWASAERIARKAMEIYEAFHGLYGELEREGERYELVLADGVLSWSGPWGFIYYPIIHLPVQLEFDASRAEFVIRETGRNPELYTAPLRDAPLANPRLLSRIQDELSAGQLFVHPLEEGETAGFLRRLAQSLAPGGQYLGSTLPDRDATQPHIGRSPVLVLRERAQGYARAIQHILADLEQRQDLPTALVQVVGINPEIPNEKGKEAKSAAARPDDVLERVLFTRPWNQEQVQIASRLDRFGCVLVQGPPGTGKTHTIGNLIGHLLAQGKSVLVTAHTSKALRVVREHIAEPLQPLAVSVLENDLLGRQQLEQAVTAITHYLSAHDAEDLHRQANQLEQERKRLLAQIAELRRQLVEAVDSEYRAIVIAGKEFGPSQAARLLADGTGKHDWIPGPLAEGAALPLSVEELVELYHLNQEVSPEHEREMVTSLPDPSALPDPAEVEGFAALLKRQVEGHQPRWWNRNADIEVGALKPLAEQAREIGQQLLEAEPWELLLVEAGASESHRAAFEALLQQAEDVTTLVASTTALVAEHAPVLAGDIPLEEQEQMARDLANAARSRGGRLGLWQVLQPRNRRFIQSTRVASGQPARAEHFEALAALAAIQRSRNRLKGAWAYLLTQQGGPPPDTLGTDPERVIVRQADHWRGLLGFQQETLSPFLRQLAGVGFLWERAYRERTLQADPAKRWKTLAEFLATTLPQAFEAQEILLQQRSVRQRIVQVTDRLFQAQPGTVGRAIRDALVDPNSTEYRVAPNPTAYRAAYERLLDLHARQAYVRRREDLLKRLEGVAPGWAAAIRQRSGVHGRAELPGDPEAAWTWRQLHEALARRGQVSAQLIQEQLHEAMQSLYRVTAKLVECRAWAYRLERTSLQHRQALTGWLNTMRRLGRGTSKRAPLLRAEASRLLSRAKDAVPVWIMPLARVAEQFDPRTTRFDVVIIDEASQCDLLGLLALYLGKQVVVVGDHEQVSPAGVGQELERIKALQDEFLHGIPNAHLYDGRRSIYDIARESFGGGIMLIEHFRCVPEIIQFSNQLCYQNRMRPLRDSSQVVIKPHVIPYRVNGVSRNRRNEVEAETIASLVIAMTRHPAYRDKTIGVISMVGDEQARLVEQLLRRFLRAQQFIDHRILCGNPAQFQGDERHVVLLSLVDSPETNNPKREGRALPLRQDDRFKQRFNVAASRARDQLWVVYSLDPRVDLQEGDLRRTLIEYAIQAHDDPEAVLHPLQAEAEKAESPFEREVVEWLARAGYRLRSQLRVGGRRIDIVVEGGGKRVAVECDGDRWHPLERIQEDLERQAVLERLGWTFVRIRGSEFYRDREATMMRVVEQLKRLGVVPNRSAGESINNRRSNHYPLEDETIRQAQEIRMAELAPLLDRELKAVGGAG